MRENTPNMVGVDISKSHLDAHRLRAGEAARFGNDAAGFEELAGWIGAADRVVHEATGRHHRAFEEALAGAGLPLARANPLRARRFAQSMGRNAKTDAVDAAVLARMGAALELRPTEPPGGALRDLGDLTVAREALARDRVAALNRQKGLRVALLRRQRRLRLERNGRQLKAVDAEIARTLVGDEGLARRLLYMAAVAATRHNPDLGRKHRDLIGRGKPPKVALVAVMRKLLLLANALLRQDRLWTPRAGDEPVAPPRAANRHTAPAIRFQPRPDTPNTGARANLEGWMHTQFQNQHLQHGYSFRYWNRLNRDDPSNWPGWPSTATSSSSRPARDRGGVPTWW